MVIHIHIYIYIYTLIIIVYCESYNRLTAWCSVAWNQAASFLTNDTNTNDTTNNTR